MSKDLKLQLEDRLVDLSFHSRHGNVEFIRLSAEAIADITAEMSGYPGEEEEQELEEAIVIILKDGREYALKPRCFKRRKK